MTNAPTVPDALAPDLILHGGKVVTVDNDFRIAEAVAIKDSRFVAVGRDDEVVRLAGQNTEVTDLQGKTAIPGIIDSHIHAFATGLRLAKQLNFSDREDLSVGGMLEEIRERADTTPSGEWLVVRGPYALDFINEGRLPDRWELDTVTGDHPFYLMMQGHLGVVNSRALELAGVTKDTPDPGGGSYMRDPETGELTGIMLEWTAFDPFLKLMPDYDFDDKIDATIDVMKAFSAAGITSLLNPGESRDNVAVLVELSRRKELTVRWHVLYFAWAQEFAGRPYDEVAGALRGLGSANGFGDDRLRIGGIKIVADGGFEGAYMREPFMEETFGPGWRGIPTWDDESLRTVLRAANDNNVRPFVHELGDAALDMVLDAMDEADKERPILGKRWTLEHGGIMPSARNIEQIKRMGVVVSTQQPMGWAVGATTKRFWGAGRGGNMTPNRTWLDAGITVKGGSDVAPYDPMLGIWSYVTRKNMAGDDMDPAEAITREEALRLYTINGAYGTFEEDVKGSIEAGKLADLVVLSDDLLTVPEDRIREIKVLKTIVGGETVFRAAINP